MLRTLHRARERRGGHMLLSRRSRSRGEQQTWPSGMGQAQMPANPTRKTEVQAYSFEIRRMNSALVRKDPVMVHDPLRTHTRSTMVGVILSVIGLLGFLVFGIIKPKPTAPDQGIVIGQDSGQIYVKVGPKQVGNNGPTQPATLIPTYNLASARLMLQNPNPSSNEQDPNQVKAQNPTVVPDEQLNDIPVGAPQGIPEANVMLPTMDQRISDNWSVCNSMRLNKAENPEQRLLDAKKTQKTAILAGTKSVSEQLKELPSSQAILVNAGGYDQLIYRPAENVNQKSDIVRMNIEHDDTATRTALKLNDTTHNRPVSPAMLEAITPKGTLTAPPIPGIGGNTSYTLGSRGRARVGDVFEVQNPGSTSYYVILKDGKQEISQAAATIIRAQYAHGQVDMPKVAPADVPAQNANPKNYLKVEDFPDKIPQLLDPLAFPTMCLDWSADGDSYRTRMYVGSSQGIPYPKATDSQKSCNQNTDTVCPTEITKPNEAGFAADEFYMPQHRAAVVHAATGDAQFRSGPIQLISDTGVRYGVPDPLTAANLGLYVGKPSSIRPAPQLIVSLLPPGVDLNAQDAQQAQQIGSGQQAGQQPPAAQPQAGG